MRMPIPEIFDGQPRLVTIGVIFYYVVFGPYIDKRHSNISRPHFPLTDALKLTMFVLCSSIVLPFLDELDAFNFSEHPAAIPIYLAVTAVFALVYLRRAIINLIIITYQRRAPSYIRLRCRQVPSCSEYMRLAVTKHGWRKGVKAGWRRLKSCSGQISYDVP